jgi:hypothetical protein
MARRSFPLFAAGLLAAGLLVAGCFGGPPPPPRPTQACGQTFTSPSQYQTSFENLGHTDTGWVTADGFVPTSLPGRTLWWMSDTMTGTANPDNSVPNPRNVHNTVVEQGGGCLTPRFGSPEFIPAPSGHWYWPGSTIVEGNTLLVVAYLVGPGSDPPPFNFSIVRTTVIRYSLPNLSLQDVTNLPVQNALPEPYKGGQIYWGIRSVDVDGTVYLYGTTRRSNLGPADVWVARAPFAQVTNPDSWEFFTGLPDLLAWNSNFILAQPMSFPAAPDDAKAPTGQFSVARYGSKYLASAVNDVLDTRVRAWIADSPQGPWQYVGVVATADLKNNHQLVYDARVADLPGSGWTAVYNVNDHDHQQQDFTLYRGQFAKPTGLPALSP